MGCCFAYKNYNAIGPITNCWTVYSTKGTAEKYLHKKTYKGYSSSESFKIIGESILEKFTRLLSEWKKQSVLLSSATAMAMLPSYQNIIAMGKPVIPLILKELKNEPDHYFIALRKISGIDPVPPEHKGRIDKMTEAWIYWGRLKKIIQ